MNALSFFSEVSTQIQIKRLFQLPHYRVTFLEHLVLLHATINTVSRLRFFHYNMECKTPIL